TAVEAELKEQFGTQASLESTAIVEFVEKNLVTTQAETQKLNPLRVTAESVHSSKEKPFGDLFSLFTMLLRKPKERIDLIAYLVGKTDTPPEMGMLNSLIEKTDLGEVRDVQYRSRPLLHRSLFLQGLLGQSGDILNDPAHAAQVKDLI